MAKTKSTDGPGARPRVFKAPVDVLYPAPYPRARVRLFVDRGVVFHERHALRESARGDGLLRLVALRGARRDHDRPAVASERVSQHRRHHRVPVPVACSSPRSVRVAAAAAKSVSADLSASRPRLSSPRTIRVAARPRLSSPRTIRVAAAPRPVSADYPRRGRGGAATRLRGIAASRPRPRRDSRKEDLRAAERDGMCSRPFFVFSFNATMTISK